MAAVSSTHLLVGSSSSTALSASVLPLAAVQVSMLTLYSLQYVSPSGVVIQYGIVSFGAATGCGTGEHADTVQSAVHLTQRGRHPVRHCQLLPLAAVQVSMLTLYSLQYISSSGVVIQYGIVSCCHWLRYR